jgi:hypothetical protein
MIVYLTEVLKLREESLIFCSRGKMRHKSTFLFPLILLSLSVFSYAQLWSGIIDPSRATADWSSAGIPGGIPARSTNCSTIAASTYNNGSSDATSGIQSALSKCASGQVVLLGAGTFLLKGVLVIPANVSLRGAGANQTILNIQSNAGSAAISLGATPGSAPTISNDVSISGGTAAGSTSITVSKATGITVGSYLQITELNDPSFVTINGDFGACTWCDGGTGYNGTRSRGQVSEVTSVSGNTIGINPGLYLGYTHTPLASPFNATAKYAGVENLQVYANNTGAGATFYMGMCAYCWISGVEDNYSDGDHVDVEFSYHGEIVNNYFSNSYLHTPGTYDSCVSIRNKTTGLLMQNNILERLHVSIMLEWGASGNVLAYNYMQGNFDQSSYNFMISDIDGHGAHPQMNLFEGNIGAGVNMDSGWGSNSHQTFFRNWEKGTTKICIPLTGRGTVNCNSSFPTSGYYVFQENNAFLFGYESSSINMVGDVAGSSQMAGLLLNGNGGAMPQVDTVVAECGPSPCGAGSKNYGSQATGWAWGYGTSSDGGGGTYDSLTPYSSRFFHGEYSGVTTNTSWASSVTHNLPPSFYMSSQPSWWATSVPYPAIGPDVSGGIGPGGHAYAIPAEVCYESVMGGTDGRNTPLSFNASTCYPTAPVLNPPSGLTAIVN